MLRSSLTFFHVAPASSDAKVPPSLASICAYTRFESAPDTDIPILPRTPLGMPGWREISVQWSPPSVDLNRPLPGPPLDIMFATRKASQSDVYITSGLLGSKTISMPPVLSSRNRILSHVFPPSLDRNMPRSTFGPAG